MTLREANQELLDVDCRDPDAVANALTIRARALAEFASCASKDVLEESLAAGNTVRERLERAQIEASWELHQITTLSRGLGATVDHGEPDRVTCFG